MVLSFSRYRYSSNWVLRHLGYKPTSKPSINGPFSAITHGSTVAYTGSITSQFASKNVAHRLRGAIVGPHLALNLPNKPRSAGQKGNQLLSINWVIIKSISHSSLSLPPSISISTPYIPRADTSLFLWCACAMRYLFFRVQINPKYKWCPSSFINSSTPGTRPDHAIHPLP